MTPKQAAQLVAILKASFPSTNIGAETVKVYAAMMADLDFIDAQRAIREVIAEARFFPTIAEIRERVAENATCLPSAEQAWLEVSRAALRWDGGDSGTWWPEWTTKLIPDALVGIGGLGCVTTSTNPSADRAQFIRIFNNLRRHEVAAVAVGAIGAPAGQRALTAGEEERHS